MAYVSRVFRILVASPSDVKEERNIVSQVIQEWNDLYSYEKKVVLLPLKWETHSSPELGTRPQAIINEEVVDYCDLAIGVFWTRVGSPTGISVSGTIEEIERVGNAGKTVMLYFSQAKVEPDAIDFEQYQKLKDFKNKTYPKGLVTNYSDIKEFKDKLTRQLELKIRGVISQHENIEGDGIISKADQQTAMETAIELIETYINDKKNKEKGATINIDDLKRELEAEIKARVNYNEKEFLSGVKTLIENGGFPDKTAVKIHKSITIRNLLYDYILESPTHIYPVLIKSIKIHYDSKKLAKQIHNAIQGYTAKDFLAPIAAKGKSLQPILIFPSCIRFLGAMSYEIPILKYIINEKTFKNWESVESRFISRIL
jgi:hypothetical protein